MTFPKKVLVCGSNRGRPIVLAQKQAGLRFIVRLLVHPASL